MLLEGAQGALLDVDHGTYPYVTSSTTTAGGAAPGAGIGPTAIQAVLGVVKAYTTRVGNGPLPTTAEPEVEDRLRKIGGEFGAVTGRPRRCGWFDASVVRYAARINGLTALAVTKLDVLDGFETIPVANRYQLNAAALDDMPSEAGRLEQVRPVYETLPGWRKPHRRGPRVRQTSPGRPGPILTGWRSSPGSPIRYVSVGTRRDQIIEVRR